jgi:hypothetical protein
MPKHAVAAALTALALRLGFVRLFPTVGGDSAAYLELARNLLDAHVFGLWRDGRMMPTDARPPGYPLFVAAVYGLAGRSDTVLLVAQAVLDVAGCFVIAALAARLAPEWRREHVQLAGLWLAALCPFLANYAAVPLTEVLAAFLSGVTLLLLVRAWQHEEGRQTVCDRAGWLAAGGAAGLATLVRAESPLLMASAGAAIGLCCGARRQWARIARTGVWLAAGLLLPLLPWAVRNEMMLGRLQFLSTRYAEMPGEYVTRGFYDWTNTWLVRFRDVYAAPWKLDVEPIHAGDLPAYAFDSPEERARVQKLLNDYNDQLTMTPQIDHEFGELARERTRRHPLRTWLWVPLERVVTLWLTPRVELLPYTGEMTPLKEKWEFDREDLLVTLTLGLVNLIYLALMALGGWLVFKNWRQPATGAAATALAERWGMPSALQPPGAMFLAAHIVVRTLFLTRIETPEPRYLLVCFPAVLALAAQVWRLGRERTNPPSQR